MSSASRQRGMTLVELVISIVVIGIAAAAMFSAMAAITGRSADPMLRQQSLAIAEAYMEEISLQAFADPDGQPDCGRACFDDVGDYDGLDEAPVEADEVVNSPLVKSDWDKTPRNSPCPCGSGKKFKQCHGQDA